MTQETPLDIENEPRIEVVLAQPGDARGIQEVYYRTWLDTYPNEEFGITIDDIEDQYKDAFTEETLQRRATGIEHPPEGHLILVAKDGEKVVGTSRIIQNPDKDQLKTIYVLPEYQGKGIGRALWNKIQTLIDTSKDMVVQVTTYNTPAIEFYKRLGFEDTGKRWEDEKFKFKSGAKMPEQEMIIKAKK
jgi:hypothetical protein